MANERNRSIVRNYICYKLSKRGYAWGFGAAGEDEEDDAASAAANNGVVVAPSPTLVLRCRRASSGPDRDCSPKRSSGPDPLADIHRVLREAGDELERLYQPDFSEMSRQLYLSSTTAQRRFAEVIDELFRDGVNWGRIIAFFEFGGTVCVECATKEDMTSQVDHIAEWMTEYLNGPLSSWIQENGGWDAFVELYDRQRDSLFSCSWPSIKTVFGLAALGAASLTIGAYLTQK
ncbi:apoptosis regulator Bcl-2 [Corythoichthys intestinalis]|uniref:apoptosis regulator Bcl-2 n=1 Tax=Corythoichthys intestinalis TaxID=161448 RepID=UPI0025A4FDB7|nr:apoptosis regulator Bcl-2 [Corythoichthys intestinalis]XP_061795742.1 apoptosis regulator Bcl-2-like [Nerophis lumbriciformis]